MSSDAQRFLFPLYPQQAIAHAHDGPQLVIGIKK